MTKSLLHDSPIQPPALKEFLWTIGRYHQAIELGVLTENGKVELLFGKLIEKMPMGKEHAACINKLSEYLMRATCPTEGYRKESGRWRASFFPQSSAEVNRVKQSFPSSEVLSIKYDT